MDNIFSLEQAKQYYYDALTISYYGPWSTFYPLLSLLQSIKSTKFIKSINRMPIL